jgi:hypothetical protein
MSIIPEVEIEHRSDEIEKVSNPRMKILFLPLISPNLPIGIKNIAVESKKAVEIQAMRIASISNSFSIIGIATLTADAINGVKNDAMVEEMSTIFLPIENQMISFFKNFFKIGGLPTVFHCRLMPPPTATALKVAFKLLNFFLIMRNSSFGAGMRKAWLLNQQIKEA